MFPALQVLAHLAPRAVAVPVGGHVGLAGRGELTLGRGAHLDVPVASPAVAETHCALKKLGGNWLLTDAAAVWGTYLNGHRLLATQVLRHGDVVELKGAVAFRFLDRPANELRNAALEAPLVKDPTDEAAWAVYSDWLTEHGSALAEQVSGEGSPEAQARWLGPLARLWVDGELELEWRHGHVVRAVLRRLQEFLVPRPEVIVGLLLEAPVARFLQALEVDFSADHARLNQRPGPAREKFAAAMVRAVARSQGAPGLASFTLGPATRWQPTRALDAALEDLAKRRPAQQNAPGRVVRQIPGAALELLRQPREVRVAEGERARFPLALDGSSLVAPRGNALVKLLPAKSLPGFNEALVVWHLNDVWTVAPPASQTFLVCSTLVVNGRERRAQCLRHGDRIELPPGLEFRFVELAEPEPARSG